jgi:hypothetical protein
MIRTNVLRGDSFGIFRTNGFDPDILVRLLSAIHRTDTIGLIGVRFCKNRRQLN